MIKIEPLKRGFCPECNKMIMNANRTEYINGGMSFWVEFQDGTKAEFSICSECYKNISQEMLDRIIASQKVNWGIEIARQMQWYYEEAIHLRIVKQATTKDGLTS